MGSVLCRSATSPSQLVDSFPPPDDHIRTLHDNYEHSFAMFAQVRPQPV